MLRDAEAGRPLAATRPRRGARNRVRCAGPPHIDALLGVTRLISSERACCRARRRSRPGRTRAVLRRSIRARAQAYAARLPPPPQDYTVERHHLTPLFNPRSIVVFAGHRDAEPPCREAATLRESLAQGTFKGSVTWLDTEMTGTLADLAQSRADLALVALPAKVSRRLRSSPHGSVGVSDHRSSVAGTELHQSRGDMRAPSRATSWAAAPGWG